MISDNTIILLLVVMISAIFLIIWRWKNPIQEKESLEVETKKVENNKSKDISKLSLCPICGEHLLKGNRVYSSVFKGEESDLMRIYGCPACREDGKKSNSRQCPCCKTGLPKSGYLIAKAFHPPDSITQVRVYGCSVCMAGRA